MFLFPPPPTAITRNRTILVVDNKSENEGVRIASIGDGKALHHRVEEEKILTMVASRTIGDISVLLTKIEEEGTEVEVEPTTIPRMIEIGEGEIVILDTILTRTHTIDKGADQILDQEDAGGAEVAALPIRLEAKAQETNLDLEQGIKTKKAIVRVDPAVDVVEVEVGAEATGKDHTVQVIENTRVNAIERGDALIPQVTAPQLVQAVATAHPRVVVANI